LRWQLTIGHPHLNNNKPFTIEGASYVKAHDTVFFQQNYYDLGALIYQKTPLLGYLIGLLKKRIGKF
jgi:hypothetical protein